MKGFTLLEILVVVSIVVLLVSAGVSAFQTLRFRMDLDMAAQEIAAVLRSARVKTLASEDASFYGVYFDELEECFILFRGDVFNPDDSANVVHNLPGSVEISAVNLGGSNPSVIFERVEGTTESSGSVVISLKKDQEFSKIIYIQSSGQVGIGQSPSTPTDNRIKDSRHVHFNLSWSIQDASHLKFDFTGASQVETVEMGDYFNTDKTEFDWGGTFLVGGVEQVFRVHTHNLTVFDTLLCIHRDRNEDKNTKEVKIFIIDGGVDKEIAHYLADINDTVLKGEYIWDSMEIQ